MNGRMTQPPSTQKERKLSGVIMIAASVIYGISLLVWVPMLSFVYFPPPNIQGPTVIRVSLAGWPVAIGLGLGIGWWKRRYVPSIVGSLAPALLAVAFLVVTGLVKPEVFDPTSWVIDPKAMTWQDGGMAGIMLGEDADTTIEVLGAPWVTLADERTVPPQDGMTMARQGLPATWQYPAVGLTVSFTGGRIHQITVAAPNQGGTVRDLRIGEDMADVATIFGEHGSVTAESENGKQRSVYAFENPNFRVTITGDSDGKVQKVSVTAKKALSP